MILCDFYVFFWGTVIKLSPSICPRWPFGLAAWVMPPSLKRHHVDTPCLLAYPKKELDQAVALAASPTAWRILLSPLMSGPRFIWAGHHFGFDLFRARSSPHGLQHSLVLLYPQNKECCEKTPDPEQCTVGSKSEVFICFYFVFICFYMFSYVILTIFYMILYSFIWFFMVFI